MSERYLGKTLGKYRVEELIGSGGFAWVYRAFDPALEIPVALKVLKPQFAGDKSFEERFRREASTAARLRHPNIVKIYEVGRDGEAVYFAMDFLPSGLATKLDTMPHLAEDAVIKVGMDVARALGFAHREGVIHRDIKVDNILFDVHGNAVVADFGIARAVSGYTQQTGTNMVVGTPQYFAPEQARAKPLDGRADIYSLGVSLYRASTGRLPFEGDDWYEIARAHVEDVPARPRSLNPAISPAFESLLLRCLAKHPDDRPTTGEQLADELGAVLSQPRGTNAAFTGSSGAFLSPTETPTITERAISVRRKKGPARTIRRVAVIALGVIGVLAAALPLAARRSSGVVTPPPRLPGGTLVGDARLADSIRNANLAVPVDPIDSIVGALAKKDTQRVKPRPTTGKLQLVASEGVQLSVNGIAVGTGVWTGDTLKPASYRVRGSIATLDGCETATMTQQVQLAAGASRSVNLSVRPCGSLTISVLNRPFPTGARYTVVGDGVRKEGALPLDGPLVLPIGVYDLKVSANAPCQDYEQSPLRVSADQALQRPIRLLCDAAELRDRR